MKKGSSKNKMFPPLIIILMLLSGLVIAKSGILDTPQLSEPESTYIKVIPLESQIIEPLQIEPVFSPEPVIVETPTTTENEIPTDGEDLTVFDFSDVSKLTLNNSADFEPNELHLVSRFTTYHPCCAGRVANIQNMADLVDETIIPPGEIFSLNGHVGERTEEKGFVPAGTIMGGELVNTVGGGVSQFATTMYNAIYWAGLQDISHQPHSWTFSRYPTGIEATMSWPYPDLRFKNNTDNHLVIHTSHTDTSITVEVWGQNDGRILTGKHSGGETTTEILNPGGKNARVVTSYTTPAYEELNSIPTYTYPNIGIRSGFEIEMNPGTPGKIVNVFRTITQAGVESTDTWKVVYKPVPREIHVHPCDLPANKRTHEYEKYDYSWVSCPVE